MSVDRIRRARSRPFILLCLVAAPWLAPPAVEAGDVIYVHDDVGRLVGAIDPAGNGVAYRYDAVGNLVEIVRGAAGRPVITSITPTSGAPGTAVAIAGTGFSTLARENRVTFNGAPAVVSSTTATRLVASVPVDATTGPVTVTTPAGSARSAASFTVSAADLVPTALTAPGAVSPRQRFPVAWSVSNRGTGAAKPRWSDFVYLSPDTLCCQGDMPVAAAESVSSLGPGQSYSRTPSATVPRVAAGHYYLIVNVDDKRAVAEADTTNNRRAIPIAITTADLAPTSLTAPARVVIGQTVTASWTAANQGAGTAYGQRADALFLASGPECCDDARFLGSVLRDAPLAPAAGYSAARSFVVPALSAGSYHLVVAVDSQDGIEESDEANNRRAVPITITAPDLTPTALAAPPSVATEQKVSVSWTVQNHGDGPASQSWSDRIYLSESAVCCGGTVVATVARPSALAPGASYTQTRVLTMPAVPPGDYSLFVHVNVGPDPAPEVVQDNNHRMVPITVTAPDLVASGLSAPAAARGGDVVSLGWTVTNQGAGAAQPAWTDAVYLSADPACCAGDTLIASAGRTTALAPGGSYSVAKRVTIPARPAGAYYLILKADSGGKTYETDEGNNQRVVPLTIAP